MICPINFNILIENMILLLFPFINFIFLLTYLKIKLIITANSKGAETMFPHLFLFIKGGTYETD